jgi:uncharacterized protein
MRLASILPALATPVAAALAVATFMALPSSAQTPKAAPRYDGGAVLQAVQAGVVGEQADGYLAFVRAPTPAQAALQRAVNENTIRRRTAFADKARETGESIDRVAVASALRQITRLEAGEWFRDQTGQWCAKTDRARIEIDAQDNVVIRCAAAPAAK